MKASQNRILRKFGRGWTLVEMLVVVGMIGSLAAISFPVYKSIQKKVESQKLELLITSFERAVDDHQTEYNYLPYVGSTYPSSDSLYKDNVGDQVKAFVTILYGLESVCNFKQIRFFDAETNSGNGGLELTSTTATLIDPWGNEFQRIRVDHDLDGTVPWHYGPISVSSDYDPIRKTVALISFGPDAKAGSWQGGTHLDNLHNFPVPW